MGRPTKEESEKKEATFQSNRPEQGGHGSDALPVDRETLSHNWQANSPAVDLSYPGAANEVNVIEQSRKAEEAEKGPKVYQPKAVKEVSAAEYDRRTRLDVSDPLYINPSLDHVQEK